MRHHMLEYLFLVTSVIIFLVFLSIFRGEHIKQFIVLTVFVIYYVLWGIVHHARDQSLHLKIVLEYILVSLVILASFLFVNIGKI